MFVVSSRSKMLGIFLIEVVHGKPQAHLDAGLLTVWIPQSLLKGALDATEPVVDFLHAIQTDANIGKTDL